MAVFVAVIAMTVHFRVEVVARGRGKIVPAGQVQVVQPEFHGKITAIHVDNGTVVRKGDVLVQLDPTDALAEVNTAKSELERLLIENARIGAWLVGLDGHDPVGAAFRDSVVNEFAVPPELAFHPFHSEQLRLLEAEVADLMAELMRIDARAIANRKSIEVTHADIAGIDAVIETGQERLDVARKLMESGTGSRAAWLDALETFNRLGRERDVLEREIDRKVADGNVLAAERSGVVASWRSRLLQRRSGIDTRLAELRERVQASRRLVDESRLVAPASGSVDRLQVFTVGGVVEAGQELMRIVPQNRELVFEAMFSNDDAGFLAIGQKANVRIDAYPAERFGFVNGHLLDVAADALETADGSWGFKARIIPSEPYLGTRTAKHALKPGMTGTVDVVTDERRIITYFFAPIAKTVGEALGER